MPKYKYSFTCSFDTDERLDSDKISEFVSNVSDIASAAFFR